MRKGLVAGCFYSQFFLRGLLVHLHALREAALELVLVAAVPSPPVPVAGRGAPVLSQPPVSVSFHRPAVVETLYPPISGGVASRVSRVLARLTCISSGSVCGGKTESVAAATGTFVSEGSDLSCGGGPIWDWCPGSDPCPGPGGSASCGNGKGDQRDGNLCFGLFGQPGGLT